MDRMSVDSRSVGIFRFSRAKCFVSSHFDLGLLLQDEDVDGLSALSEHVRRSYNQRR